VQPPFEPELQKHSHQPQDKHEGQMNYRMNKVPKPINYGHSKQFGIYWPFHEGSHPTMTQL
jgi:hypothetical protein